MIEQIHDLLESVNVPRFRKIALTNSLSRKISRNELTIDEAKSEFIHLRRASLQYSFY